MRTQIGFSILMLLSANLAVAAKPVAKSILLISVQGHYSKQFTEIRKEAHQWVCKTELAPYNVSRTQPFKTVTLASLGKDLGRPESRLPCRDLVTVTDNTSAKPKTYKGCADEPNVAKLLEETAASCGRL